MKNIFNYNQDLVNACTVFWNWFCENEKKFYNALSERKNVENDFFNPLTDTLDKLREGLYFVAGMPDKQTAELIFTAEGKSKHFVFVEALVALAPEIPGWKFVALKPANIGNMRIRMDEYIFSTENIWFYSNIHKAYPDKIDIMIVHKDYTEENKDLITNGCFLLLENLLGEINFASVIDAAKVCGAAEATEELVPVTKLNAFIEWRQKEFIEKYEDVTHNTGGDAYSTLEATLKNGDSVVATVNTDLLAWDKKASHPWLALVEIMYDGSQNYGMPSPEVVPLLEQIENDLMEQLKDSEGYLFIARQTGEGAREIHFACKEFRKISLVITEIIRKYADRIDMDYEIYKDKYWISMNRYMN